MCDNFETRDQVQNKKGLILKEQFGKSRIKSEHEPLAPHKQNTQDHRKP